MIKDKLLASCESLDKMERLVNDYFFSISYTLKRTLDTSFKYCIMFNGKPYKEDKYYVLRRGFKNGERFYFYKKENINEKKIDEV